MARPFKPSVDELNSFLAATALVSFSFIAFYRAFKPEAAAALVVFSASAILLRELGQRIVARWMVAETQLELSLEGGAATALGALTSLLSGLPILLLFPVYNSLSLEKYEHWAKSIDAMWIKRKYWLVSGGILGMFAGWSVFYSLGMGRAAEVVSFFALFQMMPFDYSMIPTGTLDGSIILRWSGFMWLLFTGISILMVLAV